MNPLVSIVMGIYNGEKHLSAQIRSILCQSYKNVELLLVDDVSTDESFRISERFAAEDCRITVHKNSKNLGVSRNFLSCLSKARGEFVCFSDQDDIWREDKIERLLELLRRDSRNMLAYSDLEVCDKNLKTTHRSFWRAARIKPRNGMIRELALLRNIIPGCSMLFHKKVSNLLRAVPPQSSLMHDHLAFIAAASLGRIVFTRKPLVQYRQHSQNTIGAFYPSISDRSRFQRQLCDEIHILRQLLPIDLEGLGSFLNKKAHKSIFSRLKFIRYYLFLRPDTLISKGLGVIECLFPDLYRRVLRRFRADRSM